MEFTLPGGSGSVPLCALLERGGSVPLVGRQRERRLEHALGGLGGAGYVAEGAHRLGLGRGGQVQVRGARGGPWQKQSGLDMPRADDEPNFHKLHRIIEELPEDSGEQLDSLLAGTTVNLRIASWFPTKEFEGEKWIALAKTEWCGGANHALAWTIVVASVAIGLTVTFAMFLLFGSRKMADVKQASEERCWPRSSSRSARRPTSTSRTAGCSTSCTCSAVICMCSFLVLCSAVICMCFAVFAHAL